MSRVTALFTPVLIALALAAGTGAAQAQSGASTPIIVSPATQGQIEQYLRIVKVTRPGAFAVSPDGLTSFYTYCNDVSCAVSNYSQPALRGCQRLAGTDCVILYVRNEQRRPYTRSESAGTGGQHGSEQQREFDFNFHR
ncbi:MAG: hypothetical protein R3D05_23085 [Dongiaceae bacterium]